MVQFLGIIIVGTVVAVAIMLFAYDAWAAPSSAPTAVPGIISYQGMLTDTTGQPINGSVNLTFKLYNVSTAGTALWVEVHPGVQIQGGQFNLLLGSINPIPLTIWNNSSLYLGVQVNSDSEMVPREPLTSVPYAITAGTALTVPDGAITSIKMAPTFLEVKLANDIKISKPINEYQNVIELNTQPSAPTTYLIFAVSTTTRDVAGERVRCRVATEAGAGLFDMTNSHAIAGNAGTQSMMVMGTHTFQPGNRKLILQCTKPYGNGDINIRKGTTKLLAIPFSATP